MVIMVYSYFQILIVHFIRKKIFNEHLAFQLSIILTGLEVDRNGPPSVTYPKMEDLTFGWQPRSIHLPWNHYTETNKIVNKGAIVFYVCCISLAYILTNTVNFNQPSVQSCISLYVKHMYYGSLSLMMEMLTARNVWGLEYLWQPHFPSESMLWLEWPLWFLLWLQDTIRECKVDHIVCFSSYAPDIGHVQFYVLSKLICILGVGGGDVWGDLIYPGVIFE